MQSLLEAKARIQRSIEKEAFEVGKYRNAIAKVREHMKTLRQEQSVVVLSEYQYLKEKEREFLDGVATTQLRIAEERDGMAEVDRKIEHTVIEIDLMSKQRRVLEFDSERRRNQT